RATTTDEDALRWDWLACRVASLLWDHEAWTELADRTVRLARGTGALRALPVGLAFQLAPRVLAGELDAVASLSEEMDAAADATGVVHLPYGSMLQAAWRGREAEATATIESSVEASRARGEGMVLIAGHTARAILYNGLGRHDLALAAGERASANEDALAWYNWALVELVEAAGTARGEASSGRRRTPVRVDLARAHLLYGEWLRRARRRLDARHELRTAYDLFCSMGLEAFAERARQELEATGETARRRAVD